MGTTFFLLVKDNDQTHFIIKFHKFALSFRSVKTIVYSNKAAPLFPVVQFILKTFNFESTC
jgi:hypothetical protein